MNFEQIMFVTRRITISNYSNTNFTGENFGSGTSDDRQSFICLIPSHVCVHKRRLGNTCRTFTYLQEKFKFVKNPPFKVSQITYQYST